MVGARGLGPRTSSLSETRSNQLSYAPAPLPPKGVAPREGNSAIRCETGPRLAGPADLGRADRPRRPFPLERR